MAIFVTPWKGKHYDSKRLLILGESAYNQEEHPKPVDPSASISGIIRRLKGEGKAQRWHLHFKRIFLTMRGSMAEVTWSAEGAERFFNEIAYANYIQESVGPSSSYRPTPKQWHDARVPFRTLVGYLRPAKVLVLGFDVWGDIVRDFQIPKEQLETFCFPVEGATNAKICVIPHPSSWNRLRPPCTPAKAYAHFCNKFGASAVG